MKAFVIALLTLGLFSQVSLAGDPEFPTRKQVLDQFKELFGTTPKDWFSSLRKFDSAEKKWVKETKDGDYDKKLQTCRADLTKAKTAWRKDRAVALDPKADLVTRRTHYLNLDDKRSKFVELLASCGECTHFVKKSGPDSHYSKAVCFNSSDKAEDLGKGFKLARDFIRRPFNYSKPNGGFNYLLRFMEVDRTTDKLAAKQEDGVLVSDSKTPMLSFVAVSGLNVLSMTYLIDSYYKERTDADSKVQEAIINFESNKTSKFDLKAQQVFDFPKLENSRPLGPWNLEKVVGRWYIDDAGMLEYDTEGKFGLLAVGISPQLAMKIAIDTTFQLYDVNMFPPAP